MNNIRYCNDPEGYKRVFVSLKLPNPVLQRIESINSFIDGRLVKKVKSPGFHLTLHFCGVTKIWQAKFLHSELIDKLGHLSSVRLKLGVIGSFPRPSNAKIIWLGLNGDSSKLNYIQSCVSKAAIGLGLEVNTTKFKPHITLARIKNGNKLKQNEVFLKDINQIEKSILDFPEFEIKSIDIINSIHSNSRHQYIGIGSIYLDNQTCCPN